MVRNRNSLTIKGQAATEFLVTYGWAILLVLVIMAILYSSIFKPEFYVAERCDIGPGITCDNFYLNKTSAGLNFTLYAHNSMGFDINITSINFTLEDRINNKKYSKQIGPFTKVIQDRDSFNTSLIFEVDNLQSVAPGTLYSIFFTIKFKNNEISSPPEHVTAGVINIRVA
ncbi:MAG: hypothetical protein N3G74_01395 [Candidatus Micrarchaeota archaeon]|nr:hypothetical protein [Candidatus Micrarchaeota archaeon]